MKKANILKITFQDQGQDFLYWIVTPKGTILDVQPFQFNVWRTFRVINFTELKPGGFVELVDTLEHPMTVKYTIEKIEEV